MVTLRNTLLKTSALLAVLTLGLNQGVSARADVVAVTLTPNPNNTFNNHDGFSLGWEFTANTNMTVTELGYFAGSPLTETHDVGIYTTGGSLLGSTTVQTTDPVTANFAYDTLGSPITLTAGQSYWIMGTSGYYDDYTYTPSSFSTDPGITFLQSGYNGGNSLALPTVFNDEPDAYFGPNFQYTIAPASVPEPSTPVLCGLSVIIGSIVAWRRRRAA